MKWRHKSKKILFVIDCHGKHGLPQSQKLDPKCWRVGEMFTSPWTMPVRRQIWSLNFHEIFGAFSSLPPASTHPAGGCCVCNVFIRRWAEKCSPIMYARDEGVVRWTVSKTLHRVWFHHCEPQNFLPGWWKVRKMWSWTKFFDSFPQKKSYREKR